MIMPAGPDPDSGSGLCDPNGRNGRCYQAASFLPSSRQASSPSASGVS